MVNVRQALADIFFGAHGQEHWTSRVAEIPGAFVIGCRGVYDALGRSARSCLGLEDKKAGLEALALRQHLVRCRTALRWCRFEAQLSDSTTKGNEKEAEPWNLLHKHGWSWKLIHDPAFMAAGKRAKKGYHVLGYLPEKDEEEQHADAPKYHRSVNRKGV